MRFTEFVKRNKYKPISCSQFLAFKQENLRRYKNKEYTFCQLKRHATQYYKLQEKYGFFKT